MLRQKHFDHHATCHAHGSATLLTFSWVIDPTSIAEKTLDIVFWLAVAIAAVRLGVVAVTSRLPRSDLLVASSY